MPQIINVVIDEGVDKQVVLAEIRKRPYKIIDVGEEIAKAARRAVPGSGVPAKLDKGFFNRLVVSMGSLAALDKQKRPSVSRYEGRPLATDAGLVSFFRELLEKHANPDYIGRFIGERIGREPKEYEPVTIIINGPTDENSPAIKLLKAAFGNSLIMARFRSKKNPEEAVDKFFKALSK